MLQHPPPESSNHYQFGLRHALLTMTTLAAIFALARFSRNLPMGFQVVLTMYLIGIVFYAIIRGPALARELKSLRERRRQLLDRREDFRRWMDEVRARKLEADDPPRHQAQPGSLASD